MEEFFKEVYKTAPEEYPNNKPIITIKNDIKNPIPIILIKTNSKNVQKNAVVASLATQPLHINPIIRIYQSLF